MSCHCFGSGCIDRHHNGNFYSQKTKDHDTDGVTFHDAGRNGAEIQSKGSREGE